MTHEINLLDSITESTSETQIVSRFNQPSLPGFEKWQSNHQPDTATQARVHIKRIIEAMLFASNEPLSFNKIREIIDTIHPLPPRTLRSIIEALQDEYLSQQRAFRLDEIAQGFVLRTREEYSPYIELLGRNKRTEKLSHAAAEVLAIIAYKQPITRPQIESIRGVDSSGVIYSLLERQLIQPVGKLEAPGRPTLYGITKDFLKHFGLRDVKELPPVNIPERGDA